MVSNQDWSDDRLQSHQLGTHSIKKADVLATKIDLLLKKFEVYPQDKAPMQTLQALDSRMICEVYGNTGHSGNDGPETHEEAMFINNNEFCPQVDQGGTNDAHSIKEAPETQISIPINLP
jgi:hypothetical protein